MMGFWEIAFIGYFVGSICVGIWYAMNLEPEELNSPGIWYAILMWWISLIIILAMKVRIDRERNVQE